MTVDQIRRQYLEQNAIEEGKRNKSIEVAKEMLKDGEPVEKIMKYCKLTQCEIEKN